MCAYDWEMATIQLPQHDIAELLVMTCQPDITREDVDYYIEFHRKALEQYANTDIDPDIWREGYRYSLWDFAINRMGMYVMAHTFRHYEFMDRTIETMKSLIEIESKRIC